MAKAAVYVTNLAQVRKYLRDVEPALLPVMRDELKAAATDTVVPAAKARTPVREGTARNSIRVVSSGNWLYVKGGGSRVPYYGWLEFGGILGPSGGRRNTQVRPRVKSGRFIRPAVYANSDVLVERVAKVVAKYLKQMGR